MNFLKVNGPLYQQSSNPTGPTNYIGPYTVWALPTSEHKAIYIDTEGTFRPERIESVARARGLDHVKILKNTQVAKPSDSAQQESYINPVVRLSANPIKK
jgi:RecA/RadA recombinase